MVQELREDGRTPPPSPTTAPMATTLPSGRLTCEAFTSSGTSTAGTRAPRRSRRPRPAASGRASCPASRGARSTSTSSSARTVASSTRPIPTASTPRRSPARRRARSTWTATPGPTAATSSVAARATCLPSRSTSLRCTWAAGVVTATSRRASRARTAPTPGPGDPFPAQRGVVYSYDDLADELVAYVKEMGYSHIEIMPVNEHPFDGLLGLPAHRLLRATSRYGRPAPVHALHRRLPRGRHRRDL